jgi:uncharacterized protein YcbK (DUF882 family)
MTSLKEYLMGREVKFPITKEQEDNAKELLRRVALLFTEIGIDPVLTSGYRPAGINAKIGGAKRSAHMTCEAGDWSNKNKKVSDLISISLLKKYDLYMEDPRYTIKNHDEWIHLQTRPTRSGNRIFIP